MKNTHAEHTCPQPESEATVGGKFTPTLEHLARMAALARLTVPEFIRRTATGRNEKAAQVFTVRLTPSVALKIRDAAATLEHTPESLLGFLAFTAPAVAEIEAVTNPNGRRARPVVTALTEADRKPLRLTMPEDARRQLEEHARALGCDALALAEFLIRHRAETAG
jgi:hypothetical protein